MPNITTIDRSEAQQAAFQALGIPLDASGQASMTAPEVLAASIRRAASFLCPCPPRTLREEVEGVLEGLAEDDAPEKVEGMIQQLILVGDLLDLPVEENGRSHRMLHATPPSFVVRMDDQHVLLGIPSDGQSILSESYRDRIEQRGAVRFFHEDPEDVRQILASQGLTEVTSEEWLRSPNFVRSPSDYIADFDEELDQAGKVNTEVAGIEILDTSKSPRFYKGRWRKPKKQDDGRYVARRSRRFGADFWCYVEIREETVHRLMDFPCLPHSETPRDEAWRLQAAIDAHQGIPQVYRIRSENERTVIDVFSPLPSWAERQFRVVSESTQGEKGALCSYRFEGRASSERELLEQYLWMETQSST
jgi:hypothetical protein